MQRLHAPLAFALALAACSSSDTDKIAMNPPATDAGGQSPLDTAIAAMGGEAAIGAVTAVSIEATGDNWDPKTQGRTPASDPVHLSKFQSTLLDNLDGSGLREKWHLDAEYFFPPSPFDYTEISNAKSGWIDGVDGIVSMPKGSMLASQITATRKQNQLDNPVALLQRALANRSALQMLADEDLDGKPHHVIAIPAHPSPIRLFIDAQNGVLDKADTLEDSPALGDVLYESYYADWRMAGNVRVPFQVHELVGSVAFHDETRSTVDTEPAVPEASFDVPADLALPFDQDLADWGDRSTHWLPRWQWQGLVLYFLQNAVQATEVVPGVVWLAGGSHHSMIVELQDQLVLVEAPLYQARSAAIVAKAAELFPGKPITKVVSTHHHHDHSGGVRGALGLTGAELVVGPGLRDFFAKMLSAPHTVVPDALSGKSAPTITEVTTELALGDTTREVIALSIPTAHADGMLSVWLPKEGILFVSDLFIPGLIMGQIPKSGYADAAGEFYRWIGTKSLPVQKIVGGHGGAVGTLADLKTAVGG